MGIQLAYILVFFLFFPWLIRLHLHCINYCDDRSYSRTFNNKRLKGELNILQYSFSLFQSVYIFLFGLFLREFKGFTIFNFPVAIIIWFVWIFGIWSFIYSIFH